MSPLSILSASVIGAPIATILIVFELTENYQAATAVSDWSDPLQADWLRDQGVTHIYTGKKGGFFDPAALARTLGNHVYGRKRDDSPAYL